MNKFLLNDFQREIFNFASCDDLANKLKECYGAESMFFTHECISPPSDFLNLHQSKKNYFIQLDNLNKILEFYQNDLVIKVETGINIFALNNYLKTYNQCFFNSESMENCDNLLQSNDFSLINLIANNNGGFYESFTNGLRHQILGLDVILPHGKMINGGGKVVKNVTGFDITKLFIGSHNCFGLPVRAYLRLKACEQLSRLFVIHACDIQSLIDAYLEFGQLDMPLAGLDIVNRNFFEANYVGYSRFKNSESNFFLFGQFMDSKINESNLKNILSKRVKVESISMDPHIYEHLSGLSKMNEYPQIEISVSLAFLPSVLTALPQALIHYRPKTNRLFVNVNINNNINDLVVDLEKLCLEFKENIVMNYRNHPLANDTKRLPLGNYFEANLFHDLKEKIDPYNCFNPLVLF